MKLCMISLGCDKNLVDSEMMMGLLRDRYEFTDDEEDADVIMVNTCCFILDAQEESVQTLLRVAEYKHTGHLKELIVVGCMAERYRDEIPKEIPEVDRVMTMKELQEEIDAAAPEQRMLSTPGWYAYLKIAEGCGKHCTYCIIPKLRGAYRSYPMENLLAQARMLAAEGVRELLLVAQETTLYGTDLYGRKMLPTLLRELSAIDGIEWIRLLYAYPEEITDELIETMAKLPKVLHYIDMPIQHASDRILRRMGRLTSRADLESVIDRLRTAMPDITLRTTLIAGFPGETEEDHQILMDFVEKSRFEKLGVFPYSREDGTPAAQFPDQIDQEVKEARRDELMLLQQRISAEHLESVTGRVLDVMIEGRLPEEGCYVGRSYMDAPDIDGYVFVETDRRHESGVIVKVRITGSSEYDLIGTELRTAEL